MNKSGFKSKNTFEKIYALVKLVPAGKVATYGQIAALVRQGLPARVVGYALNGLVVNSGVPWHRVVNAKGKISYAASRNQHDLLQHTLLEKEGIEFSADGFIDLNRFGWIFLI
jgi:methylated-DNA-protein-cysteine methyltransferase-like protein